MNVLVNPVIDGASIIDIDGLVVPGEFPPDVQGAADFIAPKIIKINHLKKEDPDRILPSIYTEKHPTDTSNRIIKAANAKPTKIPWKDTDKIPYTSVRPYLSPLFRETFIDGGFTTR